MITPWKNLNTSIFQTFSHSHRLILNAFSCESQINLVLSLFSSLCISQEFLFNWNILRIAYDGIDDHNPLMEFLIWAFQLIFHWKNFNFLQHFLLPPFFRNIVECCNSMMSQCWPHPWFNRICGWVRSRCAAQENIVSWYLKKCFPPKQNWKQCRKSISFWYVMFDDVINYIGNACEEWSNWTHNILVWECLQGIFLPGSLLGKIPSRLKHVSTIPSSVPG